MLKASPKVDRIVAVDLVGHGKRVGEKALDQITRDDYVEDVVDMVQHYNLRDVVIVGHSMAGTIIPLALPQLKERVKQIVFIAALISARGERAQQTLKDCGFIDRDHSLSEHENHRLRWCNDMDEATTRWELSNTCPEPPGGLRGPPIQEPYPAWVPTTYIVTLRDSAIPKEIQLKLVQNLGNPSVVSIDAGHDAMISSPKACAELLLAQL